MTLAILLALVSTATSSATPTRVLLMPVDVEAVESSTGKLVDEAILVALGGRRDITVVSQTELSMIVATAKKKELLGCLDCDAQLADAAKVEWVVRGQVGKVGPSFIVNLSLIDGRSGVAEARGSEVARDLSELAVAAKSAATALFGASQEVARFRLERSEIRKLALLSLDALAVEESVAQNLTDVIAASLQEVEGLEVMTWKDVQAILAVEKARQLLGCQQELACMAEIGGALGADGFVAGHVGRLGDSFVIGLKLVNPADVAVVTRTTESFQGGEAQLVRAARYAVTELLGLSRSGEGTLTLSSEAGEGRVFVNGEPFELAGFERSLTAGKHLLRIEAENYLPWASDVYVEKGARAELFASLIRRPTEWYEAWWFWTIVAGAVVAAGAGTTAYLLTRDTQGGLDATFQGPNTL